MRISLIAVFVSFLSPVTAQTQSWRDARLLGPRSDALMVYDSARERVVLLDSGLDRLFTRLWEWDGTTWMLREVSPAPRNGIANACYDSVNRRILVHGTVDPTGSLVPQTWAFDGSRWINLGTSAVPLRQGETFAYDPVRQRAVLFGGYANGQPSNDTWEFNGATWSLRSLPSSPTPRIAARMVFDRARARMVLFGGWGNVAGLENETWEYDGVAWTQRLSATQPPRHNGHLLAYDTARQRTVLFGNERPWPADTWEWDGVNWTRNPTNSPGPRVDSAAVYDEARAVVVLYGGNLATRLHPLSMSDTWTYDGSSWRARGLPNTPVSRGAAAVTYDSLRQRSVFFGGESTSVDYPEDTHEWDGVQWRLVTTTVAPPGRAQAAMAFDVAAGRAVLFGGSRFGIPLADTWEWDGRTWTGRLPAASPRPRVMHAMTYDSARQRTILVGGGLSTGTTRFEELWLYDRATWVLAASDPWLGYPSLRAAFDPTTGKTLIVSWVNDYGVNTLEWDGVSLTRLSPTIAPAGSDTSGLTFDRNRGRIVFATANFGTPHLWEWTGSNWVWVAQLTPSTVPATGLVFDEKWSRLTALTSDRVAFLDSPALAASVSFGTGCGASASLDSGLPYLGNPRLPFTLTSRQPVTAGAFVLAGATQNLGLGGGCTLYVQVPWVAVPLLTRVSGNAEVYLDVPAVPALRNANLFAQALVGSSLTAGLRITLGD